MSAWVMSIAGVVALGVLVDIIVPEGEIHKYIKNIFALITLTVIISPIITFINSDINTHTSMNKQAYSMDNSLLKTINSDIYDKEAEKIETILDINGYKNVNIRIYLNYNNELDYIIVDVTKMTMNSTTYNKDFIQETVSFRLGVETNKVIIYGRNT